MTDRTSRARNPDDGTVIAWTERGVGPPLLLIMGLGADGTAWEPHIRSFEKRFRCIIPDNRGAGRSDSPTGPYRTSYMADDCAAVLQAAGYGPAAVIGISMGGAIAQSLALRHAALVSRLVLVSSWARCDDFSKDVFEELKNLRRQLTPSEFTRRLQLLIWSPAWYAAHRTEFHSERDGELEFRIEPGAFSAQCDACITHDVLDELRSIAVPTLVTVGSMDVFAPMSSSTELANAISGSRLEIFAGSGHAHHWEELDRFNALCKEFIDVE